MSGQYLQKKFNIDWSKFDTRLQTKDLSPRNNDSHFIADSFKKSGQEIDPKTKVQLKAKKVTPFTCNNNESVTKNNQNSSNMLKEQYNASVHNKLMDRYNSLNSDGGINQDNSASDRYTVKLKRMKKTIDAIHSFKTKISAGKNHKANNKLSNNKDKSQEPKTVKKTNANVVTHKTGQVGTKIHEKTHTINIKKTSKVRNPNTFGNTNIQLQYAEANNNFVSFDLQKATEKNSLTSQIQQPPIIYGSTKNQITSNIPNLKQHLNGVQEPHHNQEIHINQAINYPPNQAINTKSEIECGLKKVSNLDSINHLSHNQITHTRKDLMSDTRPRNLVSGHRKALESYDSKITTNYSSSNGFANTKNMKNSTYTTHKLNTGNSLLYKNATQGHDDKLSIRKKGAGYINMKSYREKEIKATSKKKTNDFNKENNKETNHLNRMNAISAIKSSINIIDDHTYTTKRFPTFTAALTLNNDKSNKKAKKTMCNNKRSNVISNHSELVMDNTSDLISTSNILNQVSAIKTNETDDLLICNDDIDKLSDVKTGIITMSNDDDMVIKDVNIEVLACDDEEIMDLTQKKNSNKEDIDEIGCFKDSNANEASYCDNESTRDDESEFDVQKNFMHDEHIYKVDFQIIEQNQSEIKPKMRAILYDWMSEVCNDYMFKRDTYYTAIKLVDIFLMNVQGVKKSEFQLVGLCAIFISMKMLEIVAICADDLLYCTSNVFTLKELLTMENDMITKTQWMLSPMTLNHWLNLLTSNWDCFATCLSSFMTVPSDATYVFRETEKKSYLMFREQCQLIDSAVLVPETLQYNGGLLIAAFMYLLIGINLEYFDKNDVVESFHKTSYYILDEDCNYNHVYTKFLSASLKIQLSELLPYSQYASRFFVLSMDFSVPKACRIYDYVNRPYEDMQSYQAHNPNILQFVNDKMV